MQAQIDQLGDYLIKISNLNHYSTTYNLLSVLSTPRDQRLIIGIAGIPASGKSTISHRLVIKLNDLLSKSTEDAGMEAILVGLDGWHYPRATLDTFPDPNLAHKRRGAHWTFDGEAYAEFFKALRERIDAETSPISFPTFAHHIKDPAISPYPITREHRLIIIEGLHLLLSFPPWKEPAQLLDERWYVDADREQARRRLVNRHVETGICSTEKEAQYRWETNDDPNGQHTLENMVSPTRVIPNLDEILESSQ